MLDRALKQYFGYDTFRPGQKEIIEAILDGYDTLVVMPTGGGKSLCYQLPALVGVGTAIIISPLIALMKDQVDALQKANLPAEFINSTLPLSEMQKRMYDANEGKYKLLYVSPERLENTTFLNLLQGLNISFIAIDEAHCISEWGHDFRPSYLNITKAVDSIQRVPLMALTATATPEVQDDIVNSLRMRSVNRFIKGFDRPNLNYIAENCNEKVEKISTIISGTKSGSTIIYCGSRKRVEQFAFDLRKMNINALAYHAGMPDIVRKNTQERFINEPDAIILATNAFGMGIDKPNVRNVIHVDFTQTLEAYYQEAGRAGRDYIPADCYLLYQHADRNLQEFFINASYPMRDDIGAVYNALYDAGEVKLGGRSYNPIFLNEAELGKMAWLSVTKVSSVLKVLEKHQIISRGASRGMARLRILASHDTITEFYNSSDSNSRKFIEIMLRSVSRDAFTDFVEFDINHLVTKYRISNEELKSAFFRLQNSGMINFVPPNSTDGITLIMERMDLASLPVDFDNLDKRREYSFKKFDIVVRYAQTTDCKRNYILKYFHDDETTGVCGRCSSCKNAAKIPNRMSEKERFLRNAVLSCMHHLNGRFGKVMAIEFLKGKKSKKIMQWNLGKSPYFGMAKEFNENEIEELIGTMLMEGLLFYTPDMYPTLSITEKGVEFLIEVPKNAEMKLTEETHELSNDIYNELTSLRDNMARVNSTTPRGIISDRALRTISKAAPVNLQQLTEIQGVGKAFISNFGEMFLEKIKSIISINSEPPRNSKQKLSDDKERILKLLKLGLGYNELLNRHPQKDSELALIVQELIEDDYFLPEPEKFIDDDTYNQIRNILKNKPRIVFKDVYFQIKNDVSLPKVRIALAIARKEKKI